MLCSVAIGYQCFGGPGSHHLHPEDSEDGSSKVLQNVGILLQHCTVSQPRRLSCEKLKNIIKTDSS